MIVVDTNVIVYLCLNSQRTSQAQAVRENDSDWTAPPLWRSEFGNVLALNMRVGLLNREGALEAWHKAEGLMSGSEFHSSVEMVLDLAARSGCSAYDCEFVALAKEFGIRLVTADRQVLAAFPETAVSLDSF